MKILTRHFYCVSNARDVLTIGAHIMADGAHPILWNNKGLFCIISRQKVKNIIDLIKDQVNLPVLNKASGNVLHWEDGTPISAKAASKLLS